MSSASSDPMEPPGGATAHEVCTDDSGAVDGQSAPANRQWLTRGVASIGAASLFSDAGHEMTTTMLPSFLTSTLQPEIWGDWH